MIGKRLIVALMLLAMALVSSGSASGAKRFPKPIDKKSWVLPENMEWSDYNNIPGIGYKGEQAQPPKKIRIALILGDFPDQKFRVSETTADATGQKGLGVEDPAAFYLDYLFNNENGDFYNHGHTVNEYWLENSYGLVGVESEGFGPYTMDGPMYQYGVTDFGDASDCPDDSGCSGDFDTELVQKSAADVVSATDQRGPFEFRFLLHAGYDESGVWLNYGQKLFKDPNFVTDKFGPADPEHRNWAHTRYVDWTSFFAAQQIWSHALPGALSTQGESDGGSTYAHELSHIFGVLDNYNNPYAENPDRAYAGPWDMMGRGSFNGAGGPWDRWRIPPTEGGTMGSHHMIRNKLRFGFIPANEVLTLPKESLTASGVMHARILQRESPPPVDDPNLYSGLRIQLGDDASSCDANEPLCDGGGYDFYDVEVVNRQGFDSFTPDHGVLIAKTKSADASPFIWVIDSHPKDINKVDYVRADGEKFMVTVGDYRQLADATFHAGTAKGTVNRFADEANGLAFFILSKETVDGWLVYDVAVASLSRGVPPGETTVEQTSGSLKVGAVTKNVFTITNTGTAPGVYRLAVKKSGPVKTRLLNNLIYLDGGQSAELPLFAKATGAGASISLKVIEAH
ncbi:MAG: hypothetical protein QOG54_271 [Actinomycetota bacterium]|jgi:M6 family metalloprotease-like protein|nr:hypothetical protein [Actinomycetota bacterium]